MLVALLRVVCQALATAQRQLGAALISFADPGGQSSEASRGKWGLTEPGLYSTLPRLQLGEEGWAQEEEAEGGCRIQ